MKIWVLLLTLIVQVRLDLLADELQSAQNCRKALAEALLLGYPSFDQSHVLENSGKGENQLGNFDNCIGRNKGTLYILASNHLERGGVICSRPNSTNSELNVVQENTYGDANTVYLGLCLPKECTPTTLCNVTYNDGGTDVEPFAKQFQFLKYIPLSFKEVKRAPLDQTEPYILTGLVVTLIILIGFVVLSIMGVLVELCPYFEHKLRDLSIKNIINSERRNLMPHVSPRDRKVGVFISQNENTDEGPFGSERESMPQSMKIHQTPRDAFPYIIDESKGKDIKEEEEEKEEDEPEQEITKPMSHKQSEPVIHSLFLAPQPVHKAVIRKVSISEMKQKSPHALNGSMSTHDPTDHGLKDSLGGKKRSLVSDEEVALTGLDPSAPIPHEENGLWVKKTRTGRILMAFSFLRNARLLFHPTRRYSHQDYNQNMKHFDGIRVLAFAWAIVGYTYLIAQTTIVMNQKPESTPLPILALVSQSSFVMSFIYASPFAYSTFFFLSGVLWTYKGLKLLFESAGPGGRHTKDKNWRLIGKLLLYRLYRIAPPTVVSILIYTFLFSFFCSGPVAEELLATHGVDALANENWWVQLLFVNNFLGDFPSAYKTNIFWFTALIIQFSLINLISLPLYFVSWKGFVGFCFGLIGTGMIANILYFSLTGNEVSICPTTLKQVTYNYLVEPWHRWVPLGFGMMLGMMQFEQDTALQGRFGTRYFKFILHFFPRQVGYIIGFALTLIFVLVLISYEPNTQTGAISGTQFWRGFYYMLGEPLWILGAGIFLAPAFVNKARFWKTTLSAQIFTIPARLTFSAFLVCPFIEMGYFYTLRSTFAMSFRNMTQLIISMLILSYLAAIPFYILFEAPFFRLRALVFGKYKSVNLANTTMKRMIHMNNFVNYDSQDLENSPNLQPAYSSKDQEPRRIFMNPNTIAEQERTEDFDEMEEEFQKFRKSANFVQKTEETLPEGTQMSDSDSEGGFDTHDKPKRSEESEEEADYGKTSFISRTTKLAVDDDIDLPHRRGSEIPQGGRAFRHSQALTGVKRTSLGGVSRNRSTIKAFKDKTEKLL